MVMNECPIVDSGLTQVIVEGNQVNFFGNYSDFGPEDGPYTIFWDFGDGENASGILTPTHQFVGDGCYNVTFSVMDKDNEVGTALLYVGVSEGQIIVTDNFQDLSDLIPEFPSWIILPLFLVVTFVSILAKKRLFQSTI